MILSHKKENNWKGRGRLSEVFGPIVLWFLGTCLQEISSVNKKYFATHPENSAWTSWAAYTTQRNAELGRYQLRSESRSAVSATCSTWANYLLQSGANELGQCEAHWCYAASYAGASSSQASRGVSTHSACPARRAVLEEALGWSLLYNFTSVSSDCSEGAVDLELHA